MELTEKADSVMKNSPEKSGIGQTSPSGGQRKWSAAEDGIQSRVTNSARVGTGHRTTG